MLSRFITHPQPVHTGHVPASLSFQGMDDDDNDDYDDDDDDDDDVSRLFYKWFPYLL